MLKADSSKTWDKFKVKKQAKVEVIGKQYNIADTRGLYH